MALWRAEALQRLPELKRKIDSAESVMALWIELWFAFEQAYKCSPPNESLIERTYSYADWCIHARRGPDAGHDASSAAMVGFYEHLPYFGPSRQDMPQWFSVEHVAQNKQTFSYLIGEEGYRDLMAYMSKNRRLYRKQSSAHNEGTKIEK
jgi:hypothetical protein